MKANDIIDMFLENKENMREFSAGEVCEIFKEVPIQLEMDRNTLDYYYKIPIAELKNKDKELLQVLKEEGWSLDKENENLIIFI